MTNSKAGSAAQATRIELVVSDIDGTLARPDKSIADATVQAVQQLRDAGILFTVVSSRPPRGMRALIDRLGVDIATAAFNGGNIVEADGVIAEHHSIPADAARTALDFLHGQKVDLWAFADDDWLALDPNTHYVPLEKKTLGFDPTILANFKAFGNYIDRIDKIVASSPDAELLAQLEKQLGAQLQGRANAVRSQTYYLDINAAVANKGDAVAALARRMGVKLENVAVIGDAANDVPMFLRAGLSIAMGQGSDAVKAQASHVTGSNAEDGAAQAMRDIILPLAPNK